MIQTAFADACVPPIAQSLVALPAHGSLTMRCDSRAQRSFFRSLELDSRGSKQFRPLLIESDWYNLVGRLIEVTPAEEVSGSKGYG